ncbi:hypothetical protein ACOSQ4_017421 [Xanthoceras sorbifolium]
MSKFTHDNYSYIEFTDSCCVLKDKNTKKVLLIGTLKDGLYKINLSRVSTLNFTNSLLGSIASIVGSSSASSAIHNLNKTCDMPCFLYAKSSSVDDHCKQSLNLLLTAQVNENLWYIKHVIQLL